MGTAWKLVNQDLRKQSIEIHELDENYRTQALVTLRLLPPHLSALEYACTFSVPDALFPCFGDCGYFQMGILDR